MAPKKPKFHQRRYLVDKRFQMKYTMMVMFFSTLIFLVLGYKLYQMALANTQILQIQNPDVQDLVMGQDKKILYILGGIFLLQIGSLFFLGILITHRIAGPVFRVQKYLDEIVESGEIKPMNPVRTQDEFFEFFDSLSKFVDMFTSKSVQQKAKADELKSALDGGDINKAKTIIKDLRSIL